MIRFLPSCWTQALCVQEPSWVSDGRRGLCPPGLPTKPLAHQRERGKLQTTGASETPQVGLILIIFIMYSLTLLPNSTWVKVIHGGFLKETPFTIGVFISRSDTSILLTDEKAENKQEDSDSDEQTRVVDPRSNTAAVSQPQRIPLFPGMDPSALKVRPQPQNPQITIFHTAYGKEDSTFKGLNPVLSSVSSNGKHPKCNNRKQPCFGFD